MEILITATVLASIICNGTNCSTTGGIDDKLITQREGNVITTTVQP